MNNELYHYGVPGMRWGKRKALPPVQTQVSRNRNTTINNKNSNIQDQKADRRTKTKKAIKIGAAVVGTVLAVYGAKKVHDMMRDKKNSKIKNDITPTAATQQLMEHYHNLRKQRGYQVSQDSINRFYEQSAKKKVQRSIQAQNVANKFHDAIKDKKGPRVVKLDIYRNNGDYVPKYVHIN